MTELPIPPMPDECWPVDVSCCEDDWSEYDESVQMRAAALATSSLRSLTGYTVGGCPVTARPCKAGCGDPRTWATFPARGGDVAPMPGGLATWGPVLDAGRWLNVTCGCTTDCSCTTLCEIRLPPPIGAIEEVKVDGATVDPNDYRIDNHGTLVWIGSGECPWPICQQMQLPDTEDGTFSITYLNAYPVDGLGAWAAGRLACEFAKACTGADCELPPNLVSISRQGVTLQLTAEAWPSGLTGLRDVDSFITRYNPYALKGPSTVWSPDLKQARVVGPQSSGSS